MPARAAGPLLASGQRTQAGRAVVLGQPAVEHARLAHGVERGGRARRFERAQQLLADALARQTAARARIAGAGLVARAVDRRLAVPRLEAEEAQHAQAVLGDARVGIANEAHPARRELGAALEW